MTLSILKTKSKISILSALVIIPVTVVFSVLGWYRFHILGLVTGCLTGFIIGIMIEMRLIARRLGITYPMLAVCNNLKVHSNVEVVCNRILDSYEIIKQKGLNLPRCVVNKLMNELLKGLNALGLLQGHPGYAIYENDFTHLIAKFKSVINGSERGSSELIESFPSLYWEAKSFSKKMIKERITYKKY
jgi:hypothetical protein